MSGNLEMRLRKLEQDQESAARRLIIVNRDLGEDTDTVLAAESVTTTDDDLVISVVRFCGQGKPWPTDRKRVQIQSRAA